MKDWKKICVPTGSLILDAIRVINDFSTRFAVVVNADGKLLGCITDGDVRRALLKNLSMNGVVNEIMNTAPLVLPQGTRKKDVQNFLRHHQITHAPIVNAEGIVTGVSAIEDFAPTQGLMTAVLMVGGLGTRLGHLTTNCPKPLLRIGGKPVLEIIIENLKEHGFNNFIFCVNYRAEMISEHFGDGSRFGVQVKYIKEEKRMGTAGALTLLPEEIAGPILVMNGDIVTKVNFTQMLDFHRTNDVSATMGVRKFDYQIPFGVVKTVDGLITHIEEKPVQSFMVSAGIYVLEKSCLSLIPKNNFFDMPSLFGALISAGEKSQAFPIHEYWLDIGREADLAQARDDLSEESH